MDNYFESTLDNVLLWENVEQLEDLASGIEDTEDNSYVSHRPQQTVHSLQRDYTSLYGSHPKMEERIYSACCVCEQTFNPHAVASHKEHCPGKGRIQSHHLKKKVKSKKKLPGSSVPLPPLFKESPGPPVLSKFTDIPTQSSRLAPEVLPLSEIITSSKRPEIINEPVPSTSTAGPPTPPSPVPLAAIMKSEPSTTVEEVPTVTTTATTTTSTSATSSSSSSWHKRSRKSTKASRDYDPDIHCGVVEGQKGPCTRSITCSNHKIQLRKSVLGRSKNIHLLIAEQKATKEKESSRRSRSPTQVEPPSKVFVKEPILPVITPEPTKSEKPDELFVPLIKTEIINSESEIQETNINEVSDSATISKIPTTATATTTTIAIAKLPKNELHDEVESDDPSNQLESGYCSVETSLSTKSSPVLYFNPISPIFVVTPVQFIQKENTVFVEKKPRVHSPPPNGYFLTIPETSSNIKLYTSHPKPTILPTYGTRKVGGAILSSNQRLDYQRNEIQMAINTMKDADSTATCKTTSYNVPPQRSIVQKMKGINKVNCKRSSTDKINVNDNKQIKLASDVNGFILHTEMSEVAEAPQPNNHCIQENINLLNMK